MVLGQFSFIATFVLLVVSARLKKFDPSLEEAALNLGATRLQVIRYITLPFLRPAIIGSGAVAFLMSFENFNTSLFLVGSETTLPINLYLQVRDGSTPVINAISFLLIVGTSMLALINLTFSGNSATARRRAAQRKWPGALRRRAESTHSEGGGDKRSKRFAFRWKSV